MSRKYKRPIAKGEPKSVIKIEKEEYIEIKKEDIEYTDIIENNKASGFRKNEQFSLDDLPIPIKIENDFIGVNKLLEQQLGVTLPIESQKGIDKYINIVNNYKDTQYAEISVEKAIARELKKKQKHLCKISNKKKTINFK
tara:strand:- start:90 stop:509 length:420 start_codon:yes stop_codon:yes gene_type:complete